MLSEVVQLKRITDGGAIFSNFFWKNSYFNAIGSHFARVQSHLKQLDF